MTVSANIDLGQILLGGMIGIIAYFIKRTIDTFERRIDQHEKVMFDMNGTLQQLMGVIGLRTKTRS